MSADCSGENKRPAIHAGQQVWSPWEPYLSIIRFADTEQGLHGIVSWDDEPSEVHKEFASNIEEDKEKVNSDKSEESVDFGYGSLFLKVIEHRVSRQL